MAAFTGSFPAEQVSPPDAYAALTTLCDRRQRVQTRIRLLPPSTIACTV